MGYIPSYDGEEAFIETGSRTITVYPPTSTKRPVGYAPWPEEPKPKKKRKKKKR